MTILLDRKSRWEGNLFKLRSDPARNRVHLWSRATPGDWGNTLETLEDVARAWRRYHAATIDETISAHEDMIGAGADASESYRKVGLSALRIFSEAMVLTGRTHFPDILDLPCGGGRVTRHLRAFFPDSDIFVADIDQRKVESVVSQFSVKKFEFPHDFDASPGASFDLIFSGSLLTHLDKTMFQRAVDFLVRALKPGGIAALTTHGRTSATLDNTPDKHQEIERIEKEFRQHMKEAKARFRVNLSLRKAINSDFLKDGFGYYLSPAWTSLYQSGYGGSYSSPSWLMTVIEKRSDCLIIGFKEKNYGDFQDTVVLQKI